MPQHPEPSSDFSTEPVEREVAQNILAQVIAGASERGAAHTIAELNLPDPYLRRIADRVIRSSFEEQCRIVVAGPDAPEEKKSTPPALKGDGSPPAFRVCSEIAAASMPAAWREARPPARGFSASIDDTCALPFDLPGPEHHPLRPVADMIAARLAFDGLLITLGRAVLMLGAEAARGDPQGAVNDLKSAGFPVDLLGHFSAPDPQGHGRANALVRGVAQRLIAGDGPELSGSDAAFSFVPAAAGFKASAESGEHEPALIRMQLVRGDYWSLPGAGESLDLARQLLSAMPLARFIIHIQSEHAQRFLRSSRAWSIPSRDRVAVITQDAPVTQWAQDNAKPGRDSAGPAALLPRYPSRGEDGSVFLPGDARASGALAGAGLRLLRSTLLFQGGNCVVALAPSRPDPTRRDRVLLLGEGEVWRNTTLGLSADEAAAAFKAEFGVERCVVLPAASFHVDYEVCCRSRSAAGDAAAFVNDSVVASKIILGCGLRALVSRRVVPRKEGDAARAALSAGDDGAFLRMIGPVLEHHGGSAGHFPLDFAANFSVGPTDSGPGNLHRFLLAFDTIAALCGGGTPGEDLLDPFVRAYFRSFRRREADRAALRATLADLGFRIVPVPSTAEERRGTNYINGVHTPTRYLMPAYGGLYSALDDAAGAVFKRELGARVKVVPVLCAESQRRAGAVRCSVGVHAEL